MRAETAFVVALALASFARAAAAQVPPPIAPSTPQVPLIVPPGLTPMPPPVVAPPSLPSSSAPPPSAPPPSAPPPGYPPNGFPPNGFPPNGYGPQLYPPMPPWWLYQEKLPYVSGVDPPPGFHIERESNRGLVVSGTVLFLSAYVASIIGASSVIAGGDHHAEGYGPLFVPLVGPFITLGTGRDTQFSRSAAGGLIMVIDGLAQTTSLALLFVGIAAKHKVFVRGPGTGEAKATLPSPEVLVGPGTTSLRLRF